MTPATDTNMQEQVVERRASAQRPMRPPVATPLDPAPLGFIEREVFERMSAHGQPLTLRQVASLTELSVEESAIALESLREVRLVRRLNTLIESYIVAPRVSG